MAHNVLRELSQAFLECGICCGNFKEPRDLDCRHTFCWQCLTFLFEDQPRDVPTITCPTCTKSTKVPEGGIRALPRNPILEHLLEKITFQREKLLRNSCPRHEGRDLELFCSHCEIAICHVCAIENHPKPEHNYLPLNAVVKEHRDLCNERLRDIADEIVRDERNLKTAKRKSSVLREQKDAVEAEIHKAAEDMMQAIKIREQELGEELDCVLETREEELHMYCKALEKKLNDDKRVMGELRNVLEHGEDTELVRKYSDLRKKKGPKIPLAPEGLRFVNFKLDEEKLTKDNLGCLREVMIPWHDVQTSEVANGHDDVIQKDNKGKKDKSEKEGSGKKNNKHDTHADGTKSKDGKKSQQSQHPTQLPPTPPVSPRNSGVFLGPTPFVKIPHQEGSGGKPNKQTLSPSSDIFGGGSISPPSHRNQKESHRKGIRIVDPNSNQDITELIMGDRDKNKNHKVKKRNQQQQQAQQNPQQQQQQPQPQQQQQQQQQQQKQQQQLKKQHPLTEEANGVD